MTINVLTSCPTCGALWAFGPLDISHAYSWVPPLCSHADTLQHREPPAVMHVEHVESVQGQPKVVGYVKVM